MNEVLMNLQDVMQQELAAYKDILAKARQKKEALLKNDVALLDRIVAHEWSLIKTIRQLESERENLISRIALQHGMDCKTINLADIEGILEGGLRVQFSVLRAELKSVLSEIDALNKVNKGLVDTHLQYTAFCVNLLTGHINTLNTYSLSGRMSEAQERPTLVLDQTV